MNDSLSSSSEDNNRAVTVIGAGIIGASIAYQLAELGQKCTVIEQCEIACAASGKSGGFLAKDWCDSSPLKVLARSSFDMHKEFAESLDEDIGYRPLQSYSISLVSANSSTPSHQRTVSTLSRDLSWLNGSAKFLSKGNRIGSRASNAQVLPRKLTQALLEKAKKRSGTQVQYGRVEDVKKLDDGRWRLDVVEKSGSSVLLESDIVVLAMGPWTIQAKKWFPQLPAIIARKSASIVVKAKVPATAIFGEYVNSRGQVREPEAYPRNDEVYLCQSAIPEDLPDDPDQIQIHQRDKADLIEFAGSLSSDLEEALQSSENVVAQACNLPISPDGIPVIGVVPDTNDSVFIATGHSCWGILNSPATGKAIAEMIVHGSSSIDVSPFCPSRFG